MIGRGNLCPGTPRRTQVSRLLTPTARTRTRTSSSRGTGTGTSSNFRTSRSPCSRITTAFIEGFSAGGFCASVDPRELLLLLLLRYTRFRSRPRSPAWEGSAEQDSRTKSGLPVLPCGSALLDERGHPLGHVLGVDQLLEIDPLGFRQGLLEGARMTGAQGPLGEREDRSTPGCQPGNELPR